MTEYGKEFGPLSQSQQNSLLSKIDSILAPSFRINVKVHKDPAQSRPICNNGKFFLAHAGTFLSVYLQPIIKSKVHIATSHVCVVDWAEAFQSRVLPNLKLEAFGFSALYPNLQIWNRQHYISSNVVSAKLAEPGVFEVVSSEIDIFYHKNPFSGTFWFNSSDWFCRINTYSSMVIIMKRFGA